MQYIITVTDGNDLVLDTAQFPVGEWREIGWWLSEKELIDPDNKVTVEIRER